MTKTIRKLLGYLLIACLLLSGASAMAETGKITFTVEKDEAKGFTNPDGIQFELYRVGTPTGTGSAWEATEKFPGLEFPDVAADENGKREYTADQVKDMVKAIEDVLSGENAPAPIATPSTENGGKIVFDPLEAGIYYIRKNAQSRPRLLDVTPALVAVPAVGTATPYAVSVTAKRDYTTPAKTAQPVNKVWQDDDDFDEIQPKSVTVRLHRKLLDVDDATFEKTVTLSVDNNWAYTWTDLEAEDENGDAYTYSVTEDAVGGYETTVNGGEITNVHIPDYGAIKVTKNVLVNGKTTSGTLADGIYNFTITGPTEATGSKNYLNEVAFSISVTGGKSNTWSRDKLKPGTYVIKEITDGLPSGMTVNAAEQTVVVAAGTTLSNPAEATFVNDQSVASLKITKTVTVNSRGTGGTLADGTYRFTVTGPSYPSGETVSIKIKNGRSSSVQLDNLLPGEYEVAEIKTGLPASVTYVSGDTKKTLTAAHTAEKPLTFEFINNRTVTPPPSESRPTPTPGYTPTPTPEVTPTPTPTPSPTPDIQLQGVKVWRDEGNSHNTRPASITVQLYQNGVQIRETKVSGSGNRWSYSFGTLPRVDENGAQYVYTVRESEVPGYTTTVNGMTIVNDLIPQTPRVYTSFSGSKIWKDDDNESGDRPNYITVRLMRNGREVDRRTVTGANGWQYTFQNVPVDDGYGNDYHYTIREDAVAGYVGRADGFTLTNSKLPAREPDVELSEFAMYGTPLAGFGEPELEGLLELYDYGTPLWGRPLKTGDELPLYPIVFGGIGVTALIALIALIVIGKKRGGNAA